MDAVVDPDVADAADVAEDAPPDPTVIAPPDDTAWTPPNARSAWITGETNWITGETNWIGSPGWAERVREVVRIAGAISLDAGIARASLVLSWSDRTWVHELCDDGSCAAVESFDFTVRLSALFEGLADGDRVRLVVFAESTAGDVSAQDVEVVWYGMDSVCLDACEDAAQNAFDSMCVLTLDPGECDCGEATEALDCGSVVREVDDATCSRAPCAHVERVWGPDSDALSFSCQFGDDLADVFARVTDGERDFWAMRTNDMFDCDAIFDVPVEITGSYRMVTRFVGACDQSTSARVRARAADVSFDQSQPAGET
ncbi:MAG: hypothetical protein KDA28_07610, partial [Phycisphaerales bacterium]|nr:hypothetical protein [Phycisphaerales bacterium]